jgi:hypothetical protein
MTPKSVGFNLSPLQHEQRLHLHLKTNNRKKGHSYSVILDHFPSTHTDYPRKTTLAFSRRKHVGTSNQSAAEAF